MRHIGLAFLALAAACGGHASSTEVALPPLAVSLSQVTPGSVRDTATFDLNANGAVGAVNYTVRIGDSTIVYIGSGAPKTQFLFDGKHLPASSYTLTLVGTDSKSRRANTSANIALVHPVFVHTLVTALNNTASLVYANGTWQLNPQLAGVLSSTKDSVRQSALVLGDSAFAGLSYNAVSVMFGIKKASTVTLFANVAFEGASWSASETTVYLDRLDSATHSYATIQLSQIPPGGLKVPLGNASTSTIGYVISPRIMSKWRACNNTGTDSSSISVTSLKIVYTFPNDTTQTFVGDPMRIVNACK